MPKYTGRMTELMTAIKNNTNLEPHLHTINELPANGKHTPLMYAIIYTDGSTVSKLLTAKPNLDFRNRCGYTALTYAVIHGKEEIVSTLIANGANPFIEHPDNILINTIYFANTINILKILINNNHNTALLKSESGLISLMHAITNCKNENIEPILAELLKYNIDIINPTTKYGITLLMYASRYSSPSGENLVQYLINKGSNVNLLDTGGHNALFWSALYTASYSTLSTVKILINAGSNIDNITNYGWNVLTAAINTLTKKTRAKSSINTIKILIEAGIDINHKIIGGKTALILAANISPAAFKLIVQSYNNKNDFIECGPIII